MEKQQMDEPSTKTWGFRRSTIARREFIQEIGNLDLVTLMPRRSTRQPKGRGRGRGQGKQPAKTTPITPKRARGGKIAVEGNPDPEPNSDDLITATVCLPQKSTSDHLVSDQAEDSDELTLRELQERARKRQKSDITKEGNLNTEAANKGAESRGLLQSEENFSSLFDRMNADYSVISQHRNPPKSAPEEEEQDEQNDADESSDGDEDYSDPDAIYCICRQKHNNRFMICCDRCSEWFHGDCVGISEARGRLLEKNGEDYICPSCSPCQSPVAFMNQQPSLTKAALSSSSESLLTSSAGEERPSEDECIKGKIRKSNICSPKKRFKIFQSVETVKPTPEPKQQAVVGERVATPEVVKKQEDMLERGKEKAVDVPKCIGPGCNNDALPESVYCGHQCIIRHAAAAMHGLSEPKSQPEIKNKPAPKPTLKIHNLGKLFKKKTTEKTVEDEDGKRKETGSAPPAAPPTPAPVHKATGEQQPAAITSAQFYKAKTIISEKEAAEIPSPPNTQTETLTASSEAPAAEKAAETPAPSAPSLNKPVTNPPPSRAKKTMPGSPRLSSSRRLLNEVPQVNRIVSTAPQKPSQSQEASNAPPVPNSAPELRVLPVTPAPVPPSRPLQTHPNMQMRQNIRRSLTDTLLKRVKDSDDSDIPESEVEKLAVNIEREMFNMYYTTDNKYKIKYRSLLLSLKDPKNKGLFYQVVRGHITPFKLIRLSDQELLSFQETTGNSLLSQEQLSPVCVDTESENKAVKSDGGSVSAAEGKLSVQVRQSQTKKPSSAVSDMISSMLKDTTAEHKAHLFDLKCRICTGQICADDDPDSKLLKKAEPKNEQEGKSNSDALGVDSRVMESPASPTAEDCSSQDVQPDFSPPVIPAVSIVTITRRDPRTAGYRSSVPPSVVPAPVHVPVPDPPKSLTTRPNVRETVEQPKPVKNPKPPAAPPPMPKSILMKPSVPSMLYSSPSLTTGSPSSHSPTDSETSNFLSRQDTIWKGFLNMQSVAKFVTKGCIISGSAEVLKKDLPDTVHIGGRILPQTVWEYVERVKTSLTKELSVIRFYPASDEEKVAYVSLFSYFNSRRRFGVVSNICNNIKDIYVIPLCANESIPSILLPIEGPGLEQNHPNLLIGLAVCQKLKRPGAQAQDIDEKRPRIQTPQGPQETNLLSNSATPDPKHDQPYDPDIKTSSTPPGSPPTLSSPGSFSSSLNLPSAVSKIHAVPTNPAASTSKEVKITFSGAPPLCGTPSTTNTPLQTILNTIFGKKKQEPDVAVTVVKESSTPAPTVDPIVRQYQQTPKAAVEVDDNDRPYDPEEEYDPALGYKKLTPTKPNTFPAGKNDGDDDRPYDPEEEYNVGNKPDAISATNTTRYSTPKPLLETSALKDDVAYDPEDDTVFEEMQNYLVDKAATSDYGMSSTMSLSEQQKMLEDLNRQIEEQKRQLEEQEEALRIQRAAVGVSMAHFSVSDALMSPPPCFGRDPGEEMEKPLSATSINLNRDPRQYRHLTALNSSAMGQTDEENLSEKTESSQINCLVNNSLEQDLSKDNQDMPSGKLNDKRLKNNDASELKSIRNSEKNPCTSEFQEGTASSCGNENFQHSHLPLKDSGKTRQSCSSRRQHQSSSQRRSRHEIHRSYHDKKTSDRSKDDRHGRSSRHSPERSSRRSSSRKRRTERASSRERERRHQKDTSSRHSRTKDRHYSTSRSRSTRRRPSQELENNQTDQNEKSSSKRKNEPNTETKDSLEHLAAEQPQIDKCQSEGSQSGNTKASKTQTAVSIKVEPSSDLTCDTFSQRNQAQVEPNQMHNDPLQREVLQKNEPQSEKLTHNTRHQPSSQKGNTFCKSQADLSLGTDQQASGKESDHLTQKTFKVEKVDFPEHDVAYSRNTQKVLPQRPKHLREKYPEMTPFQNQKGFVMDDTLHPRGHEPQEAHFGASIDLPPFENDVQRNIHPKDRFRERTPEVQWSDPQHRMAAQRGHGPLQSRIPRGPPPEGFESCRPAGPRGPRPKIFDDCESSPDFGQRGPSPVSRILEGSAPRSFRPRGPSPVPRGFEGISPNVSEPKGRRLRPGMFVGDRPQSFESRDEFSGPDMHDSSFNYTWSTQREFDQRDHQLENFDDSWEVDVPHQVDREPFFRHPRGNGPPQQFRENMFHSRDSEQTNANNSRHCNPSFDEAERRHLPFKYSDGARECGQDFANDNFSNPRGHRTRTPFSMRARGPAHPVPQRAQQFDDFRDQAFEMERDEPHFSNPTNPNFVEGIGCERPAQMKGRRQKTPQNLRGPRAPSPHFHEQQMPPPRHTQLPIDNPCSPHFSSPSALRPLRSKAPNASEVKNLTKSCIRFDGPVKESEIQLLRRSGPLLPTPTGCPIRFYNPRMQRPYLNEPNLPQRGSARGPMGRLGRGALNSEIIDDNQRGTGQDFIQEEELRDYSSHC